MSLDTLTQLHDRVESTVLEWMEENNVVPANLDNWPLDERAKPRSAWVSKEMFAVKSDCIRRLDYYGGLEYVDKDLRAEFGNMVIFSTESDRIQEIIDAIYVEEENDE